MLPPQPDGNKNSPRAARQVTHTHTHTCEILCRLAPTRFCHNYYRYRRRLVRRVSLSSRDQRAPARDCGNSYYYYCILFYNLLFGRTRRPSRTSITIIVYDIVILYNIIQM